MNKKFLSLTAATILLVTSAWANTKETSTDAATVERFEIRAQSLSNALRAYADQTGEQIVFFSDIGKGVQSSEVIGDYTREEALQKLLTKTTLTFERLDAKTIAITHIAGNTASTVSQLQRTEKSGEEQ